MKNNEIDKIIENNLAQFNKTIDIKRDVMLRIEKYERRKSVFFAVLNPVISCVTVILSLCSIIFFEKFFVLYGSIFELYNINSKAVRFSFDFFFVLIAAGVLLLFCLKYYKDNRMDSARVS